MECTCPECAIVSGGGRRNRPPLHPIPVQNPFQIIGVDVMELPKTDKGNRYVLVFQDFFVEVAHGIRNAQSKVTPDSEATSGGDCTTVWSPRGLAL